LKVIDGIADGHFIIVAYRMLKLHLALSGTIDSQHRHAASEKVISIGVQFFLHRIQARNEDYHWRLRSMPRLPQDTIERGSSFIGNGDRFAGKIAQRQSFFVRVNGATMD